MHAQEVAARELLRVRAAQANGSAEWFETGFDLIEAQLRCDVAAAAKTAAELAEAARTTSLPDVPGIAHALHWLALAAHSGPDLAPLAPATVDAHAPRPTNALPATASVRSRARYFTARARRAHYADAPAEFLPDMFTGIEAARASGDVQLLHRAAWTLHLVLEREASAYDTELLREIATTAADPAVAPFAAWRNLQLYWQVSSQFNRVERLRELDAIERRALDLGDLRTQVHVGWDRVVLEMAAEAKEDAAALLAGMLPLVERLGDRRMLGVTFELAAEVAIERDRGDEAAAFLVRATAVAGNRGYPDRDVQQAHLRLQLATARGDAAAIAAETLLLDRLRREEHGRYQGFSPLLEQLLAGERQHLALARDLAQEREQSARTLRTVLAVALTLLVASLALLTALTVRSRRRLQTAHDALQGEVRRSEGEVQARRTLEQRLRQLERSESLGIVAGGIAHDFNNLMVAVLGNAELLRADESDPHRSRMLEAIAAAGERGARLCSQLQAYAGNQSVRTANFDVAALVRGMAPVLEAAAGPSLQLSIRAEAEPLSLEGSVTEVEQALLNLLTNARDAKATSVRIAVSREVMRSEDWQQRHVRGEPASGTFACIEVDDDGEGMSPALLERIFDPFFTTRFPGRGLGLAVVFGALRRHHGAVTVESHPGHGTCFRLYLPLQAQPAFVLPRPEATPPAGPGIAPMTVLVIDDEVHVRDLVTSSLTRRGHRVLGVGDGRDLVTAMPGLDRAARAVVLVDLSMPGLDGRDVVRKLHELHRGLPIVLMSGHAEDHLAEVARELRVAGHIAKPFKPTELERVLDQALAGAAQQARSGS